jgi:hypothetical protein
VITVVNDSVHRPIEGSVRFPLPTGASVIRYAFEIGGHMVDAMALSNRKAAEVAYKEKEAGRNVSKTEKVEGNLFEVMLGTFVLFTLFRLSFSPSSTTRRESLLSRIRLLLLALRPTPPPGKLLPLSVSKNPLPLPWRSRLTRKSLITLNTTSKGTTCN